MRFARHHSAIIVIAVVAIGLAFMLPFLPARAAACSMIEDGNGDVIIAVTCEIAAGTYNITRDFIINSGITVTAQGNTGGGTGVIINAGRHITINSTATLTANGQGYTAGTGPGAGGSSVDGGGAAHGADGADPPCCANGGLAYGSVTAPVTLGSGGGNTGATGGGAIKLSATSGTITISGTVTANGNEAFSSNQGGGAGGSIWIDADTLAGSGVLSADGQNGNGWGGPGGGGRIAIYYNTNSSTLVAGSNVHAYGDTAENWGTSGSSASGTIFIDDKDDVPPNGDLILDNNNIDAVRSDTPQLTASQTYDNLTIRKGAEYRIGSGETLALASGGTLTGGGTNKALVNIDSGGTFTVASASTTISDVSITNNGTFNSPGATMTYSGGTFTNGGDFTTVTNLTVTGSSTFTHSGNFPATVTTLAVTGGSTFTHSGTGMSITSGANFTLSGSSTFTHNSATGFGSGLDLSFTSGTFNDNNSSLNNLNSLTITSGVTFSVGHVSNLAITTLTVQTGGTLTHAVNAASKTAAIDISSTTIDLQSGGIVNLQGKGFAANSGTGAGGSGTDGGGGAHGGDGADPPCCANGGLAYGSLTAPVTLGSGGGNTGGAGGGAIKLVASGTLTVNTTINTNGVEPTSGMQGGGAGGSIWLDAGTLAGTGVLSADGQKGNGWGGPGAGGRIAVYFNTDTSTLVSSGTNVHAYGAVAENWGTSGSSASGTVFIDDKDDALPNGDLIIDNNNIDAIRSDTPQLSPASQTYDNISIKRGAEYRIGSGETLALSSGGTFTTGGTSRPHVVIDSGGTFTLPSTLSATISTIDITNNGTFNPPDATMTISGSSFTNGGVFNTVTNLTVNGTSTFTHTGSFPATLSSLTITGTSTYNHQGTGMSITSGANFTLSGSSTFTYNSATGFASGLDLTYGSGTFIAQHTSFTNQNSLTIQSGGVFQQNHSSPIAITTLTVQSGGSLTHGDNTTSHLYSVNIAATTIDLQTGSIVSVQGKGFDANSGTGAGGSGTDGGGGAHGGDGADPPCCANGGLAYGSLTQPVTLGSGGGNTGGAGGGAIKLVASGTLTVNTTINTNGVEPTSGMQGGGAGGSIWLDAGTLAGTGILSADGQKGNGWGGPGAGGRIAVYFNTDTSTLVSSGTGIHAYGSIAENWGAFGSSSSGTVFIDDKDDLLTNGNLILDNNNADAGARSDTPQLSPASQTFDNLTIRNGAAYRIGSGETLALASGGTFTSGGTAHPEVIIDAGGTFTLPSTSPTTITALDITNNGTFNPPGATMTFSGSVISNSGAFSTVTDLTVTGASTYTHSGSYPATLTVLAVTGGSSYTHSGTGMNITSGSNFTLSGGSTFTYNAATGFGAGVGLTYGSGTFIAQHTSLSLNSLTVQSAGVFQQNHTSAIPIAALTVNSGGSLTHGDNGTTHLYSLNISSTTIDLQTGSTVNLQGRGFDPNSGTGAGGSGTDGGGGAHGGDGADPPCCANGGNAYGSVTQPTTLGSGGGNTGGAGGGAVKLVATGTLTVNTTLNTNGVVPTGNNGGGAGGSIWLQAGTLAGSGTLSADGARGNTWGGPGGGGRIAVYYTTDSSSIISGGNYHAYGSHNVNWQNCCTYGYSAAGTVFIKSAAAANGDLILDNNNLGGATGQTQQLTASETYDNITIRKGADYRIGSGETLTLASGGVFTGGGTSPGEVIIDSGGTFDPNKTTMTISGVSFTLSGAFSDVTDLTYSGGTFDNNTIVGSGLTSLTLGSGANWIQSSTTNPFSGSDLVVQNGGTFTQDNTTTISVTNVTVESGGTITHSDNTATKAAVIDFSSTTFDVQTGGAVTANALGYDSTTGTGQGADAATGGGAGHCAVGGNGSTPGAGGTTYDSATAPIDLGSGGGDDTNNSNQQGGAGGGAIKLAVSGTLTVNGTVSANGQNGTANEGGGGSGGSVWLVVSDTFAGNGGVTASGGGGSPTTSSTVGGGGGGAGYIRAEYGVKTFNGTMTSLGGNKGGFGGSSAATAGGNCTPSENSTGNPVPATTSISPTTKNAGEATFTLTVNGSNFIATSVVRFQGSDRSTTFVNANQVTTQINAADIATGGSYAITVFNPGPGGGTSNSQTLTVNNPVPTTSSISPTSADRNASGFTMTVNGASFVSTSVVRFNGSDRTTTFISSVQLTATIPASDLMTAGTFPITVFNPTPSGGTSNSQTFTVTTSSVTTGNSVTLSRLKAGATGTVDIAFVLQNTLSTPLTVTFPAGFTVLSAATGGSACLSNFGFTASTLTADKTNCTGPIIMTGATVQNPAVPGGYYISWVNDDPGGAMVFITSDDQAQVSATIEPTITFNVGSQAAVTACDGTFSGNGGAVPLGALTLGSVSTSDTASIPHICARLTTDASSGAAVSVRSASGALASVSAPADTIASSTATLTPGTAGYGLCAGSAGGDTGKTDPSGGPASAAPVRTAPFNGSCSAGSHAVGGLTTLFQNIWTVAAPSLNAFARIYVKAAISSSTPAHSDYTDTLTFVVTGTY